MDAHVVSGETEDDDDASPAPIRPPRGGRRARNILSKNTRREDLIEIENDRIDLAEFMASSEYRAFIADRPRTREQCRDRPRPCPYVSCEHHLYLDVDPRTGTIKINFPGLELDQIEQTCSLDVAEHGGVSLELAGSFMNITRERARQIETKGIDMMRALLPADIADNPDPVPSKATDAPSDDDPDDEDTDVPDEDVSDEDDE